MPMIYIDDVVSGTLKFLSAKNENLTQRTYNMNGVSFTPREQAESITRFIPNYQQTYAPDFRQAIADSWPASLDDSAARKDWGWQPKFGLDEISKEMIASLGN
jgi:threonine 3-dehydrogenase